MGPFMSLEIRIIHKYAVNSSCELKLILTKAGKSYSKAYTQTLGKKKAKKKWNLTKATVMIFEIWKQHWHTLNLNCVFVTLIN